jgi:hypothetical protein
MRKSKIVSKVSKSIANKQNTKRLANKNKVSFNNVEKINQHIKNYKENKKIIDEFLTGTRKSLSSDIKLSAKTYFLFKLKNEPIPLRHKPSSDPSIYKNHNLYKSYLEKLK